MMRSLTWVELAMNISAGSRLTRIISTGISFHIDQLDVGLSCLSPMSNSSSNPDLSLLVSLEYVNLMLNYDYLDFASFSPPLLLPPLE